MAIEKDASRSGSGRGTARLVGREQPGLNICFVPTSALVEKGGPQILGPLPFDPVLFLGRLFFFFDPARVEKNGSQILPLYFLI